MTRFLITPTDADAAALATLLTGLGVHSEAEAFPIWVDSDDAPPLLYKMLPYLKTLDNTWVVTLQDQGALETMVRLMESVPWAGELHVAADDALRYWTLPQFHKAVMVEKEFFE